MLVSVRVFHLARYESYETKYPSTNLSWGSIVFWTPKNIPFQTPFTSGGTTGCLSRRRGPPARYKIVKITPGARTPPTPKPMKNHGLVKWDFPLKSTKIVGFGGIHRDFRKVLVDPFLPMPICCSRWGGGGVRSRSNKKEEYINP